MTTQQHLLYTCRQYRLLIAGSRKATPVMLERAAQAVERAKARGWAILVGDNPLGVDAAVVAACNRFNVNYVCFGISAKPRNQQIRTVQQGGLGRYLRVAGADYAARDRNMADVADQGLFIWNGESRGTAAGYAYMQQLGKPADRLTFAVQRPAQPPANDESATQPAKPTTALVEVFLDTTASEDAHQGNYGFRALDGAGHLLYQKQAALPTIPATSADDAKMRLLAHALEHLNGRVKGNQAAYTLRIVQSSRNVEGWLSRGWKRNAASVVQMASALDSLLKRFPQVEWVKQPRTQVTAALGSIC